MLDSYYADADHWLKFTHTRSFPLDTIEFHLHNYFEIYFFIAGDVDYFIEKRVHLLKYGDLLLMNNHEIHKPTFRSQEAYERIVIHFEPELGRLLSAPGFNLLDCFLNRPKGELNKIKLSPSEVEELMGIFKRLETLTPHPPAGSETLRLSYLIEILVFINQVFLNIKPAADHGGLPEALIPILEYIDNHLDEDLTLDSLGHRFFMNQSHLSRLFKKGIGSNIHEFIIYKRISKAKKLLSEGYNVTDTCSRCGFNDYANFLRMFKRKVGVSPGRYKGGKK